MTLSGRPYRTATRPIGQAACSRAGDGVIRGRVTEGQVETLTVKLAPLP